MWKQQSVEMAAVCISGTMTNDDQRTYIKIEMLCGKTPPPPLQRFPETEKIHKRAQSNVKQMMIFAYNCKGMIMTDRVLSGTTVTAACYHQLLQK
jgi:hypothetical protein